MIALRAWQQECTSRALVSYSNGQSEFLAIATPGAGKTVMAAHVARQLFDQGLIDLVICFVPSLTVANGFAADLKQLTGRTMDGELGAAGRVLTYQNLSFLKPTFWSLFDRHRVFVIFDEIHHCGGRADTASNQWGYTILQQIKQRAQFTLLLSGTPWRTDKLPVTLANYCNDNGQLVCDYSYGLQRAIDEKVCRIPQIIAIDNGHFHVQDEVGKTRAYESFNALLDEGALSFQSLLENDELLTYSIELAVTKLRWVRQKNRDAAGLIVASSVAHARYIAQLMVKKFGHTPLVVTHRTPNASQSIEYFKTSSEQWIISVGMISEGTNIPRLQVCCYLTRIKTELYFRQVLGRILRHEKGGHNKAYLYILAEKSLVEFGDRIEHDLPKERSVFRIEQYSTETLAMEHNLTTPPSSEYHIDDTLPLVDKNSLDDMPFVSDMQTISANNKKVQLSWSGQFFEQLLTLQQAFSR